ncbi:sensor histidine kinase [Chitinophaga defluvii]|uniref:Histidine kinase n=1 Tax=Chitinophaga defluvii TaxID=3163343 RepID=A0ABV2T5N7_9BACT
MKKFFQSIYKNYRYWLCQLIGWTLFTLTYNNIRDDGFSLHLDLFADPDTYREIFLGILYTHLLRGYLRRNQLIYRSTGRGLIRVWMAVIITGLVQALTYSAIAIYSTGNFQDTYDTFKKSVAGLSPGVLMFIIFMVVWIVWSLVIWAWTLIYLTVKRQTLKRQELEGENRLRKTELENIKAKLNPHFLFNSLSSIRSLIAENPERAQVAVGELAEVLRSAIMAEQQELVSLGEELEVVQHYLSIEKIRLEERLTVTCEVPEKMRDYQVPHMMLQTLVENAIKHGVAQRVEGGSIHIHTAQESPDHYYIHIENTGELKPVTLYNGLGISGTIKRLELLYKGQAHFDITTTGNQLVKVSLKLPVAP